MFYYEVQLYKFSKIKTGLHYISMNIRHILWYNYLFKKNRGIKLENYTPSTCNNINRAIVFGSLLLLISKSHLLCAFTFGERDVRGEWGEFFHVSFLCCHFHFYLHLNHFKLFIKFIMGLIPDRLVLNIYFSLHK